MPLKTLSLLSSIALFSLGSSCSHAAGLYAEFAHASNAGATDRNLGRNFPQIGWEFATGFTVAGGAYVVGEKNCFASLNVGRKFGQGRWHVSLITHNEGNCSVDGRQVPFERNIGYCLTRQVSLRPRWYFGIGGCAWRRPDYAIGDLAVSNDPLSVVNDGAHLTAMVLMRFNAQRRD